MLDYFIELNTLQFGEPSTILAYVISSFFVFFIMRSMGEMLFSEPVSGSFDFFAYKYLSPFWGYLTAWSCWFMWTTVSLAEIVTVESYTYFWFPNLSSWIPTAVFIFLITLINLVTVRLYREQEFLSSLPRVFVVIFSIFIGIFMFSFLFKKKFFSNNPFSALYNINFFSGGWHNFLCSLYISTVSYQGIELVGVTISESKSSHSVLKKTINNVVWRVLLFYFGVFFIWINFFSSFEIEKKDNFFSVLFYNVGITSSSEIVDFLILLSSLSGCNSGVYGSGRMMFILAKNRHMPRFLLKLTKKGVPSRCVIFAVFFLCVGVVLNLFFRNSQTFLISFCSASVLPGMVPWFVILWSQIHFRKVNQKIVKKHAFKSLFFPYVNYLTLAFLLCVLVGMMVNPETRFSLLTGILFLLLISFIYFLVYLFRVQILKKYIKIK